MASARSPRQDQRHSERRRILRIGLILGGKIVEERLIRERKDVTIGQSAKNTFSVPVDSLPREWPLFILQGNQYALRFSSNMDGRISDGNEVRTLATLKERQAEKRGDAWVVPLSESARGKLSVGQMTLLFQFVAEPPLQPRPHLPASVRGSFSDRIDPTMAIILAISLLLHFGVGMYSYQRDRVVRKRTARVFSETFQRPTVAMEDIQIPPPQLPTEDTTAALAKGEDKSEQKAAPDKPSSGKSDKPKGDGGDKPAGRSAEDAMRLQEEAIRYASTLLGEDFSDRGIGGGSSDRDPKNDLGAAIQEIERTGAKVEVGGGSSRGTRGEGDTRIGTGQGPQVEGPGETTTTTGTKTQEKIPRGRVKIGGGTADDDTSLDPNDVMRKIQSVYMNGLKRCHKDLLKRDPTAGGSVGLRFTVGESGRVVSANASGFDPGVDNCIEKLAKTWRFGVPKDTDGDPTDASFKISLVLQPE